MTLFRTIFLVVILLFAAAHPVLSPAMALDPGEALTNPVLEARARALSAELRCLVCQNQSIDDSDAPLARDLRIVLRGRLLAGDTDAEIRAFIVARYGEFALLKPQISVKNAPLGLVPVLFPLIGFVLIWRLHKRAKAKTK